MKAAPVNIRMIMPSDLPAIMEVENESFEFPWATDDFRRWMRKLSVYGLLAETRGHVLGYVVFERIGKEFRILSVAIEYEARRCGLATELVRQVSRGMHPVCRNRITAEVRESNLGALLFFKSLGFRAVQMLHNHYEDTAESAIQMVCHYVPTNPLVGNPQAMSTEANR